MEEGLKVMIGLFILTLVLELVSIYNYVLRREGIWLFSLIAFALSLMWLIRLIVLMKRDIKNDNNKVRITYMEDED